jgi:hypothetical protein
MHLVGQVIHPVILIHRPGAVGENVQSGKGRCV